MGIGMGMVCVWICRRDGGKVSKKLRLMTECGDAPDQQWMYVCLSTKCQVQGVSVFVQSESGMLRAKITLHEQEQGM